MLRRLSVCPGSVLVSCNNEANSHSQRRAGASVSLGTGSSASGKRNLSGRLPLNGNWRPLRSRGPASASVSQKYFSKIFANN